MVSDTNKNIKYILYNHLNLPTQINFGGLGNIYYLYDATGKKLRKIVHINNGTADVTTSYLDGFQYMNDIIQFFPTAEGYANRLNNKYENEGYKQIPRGEPDMFSYVYNYTDHLGNIRLSYSVDPSTNALKIIEENHYYPFGLKHNNYNSSKMLYVKEGTMEKQKPLPPYMAMSYNYRFNSKEYQDELGLNWYDFGGRQYMPDIVRTPQLDPLCEKFYTMSGYSFLNNNPLSYVDPTGKSSEWVPSVNGNMIAENGDNAKTLSKQLNISESKAQQMINSQGLSKDASGNVKAGEKVSIDSNYSRALTKSNSEKGLTTKEIQKENLGLGDSYERSNKKTDAYNCTDAAICGVKGVEITPANGDKYGKDQLSFSSMLQDTSQFTPVTQSEAKFGQTIYSFNNEQGTHAAVYYGTSKDGTIFVFSKNGEYAKPAIMPLKAVQEIYGAPSAMYNPKK